MKKALLIITAVILLVIVGGGCWFFNQIYPMAPDLAVLDVSNTALDPARVELDPHEIRKSRAGDIALVIPATAQDAALAENGGDAYAISESDAADILAFLADAKPTRRMCMDDYPSVRPYICMEFTTDTRGWRICFYRDGDHVYAELPYEGVYRLDDSAWNFVNTMYKSTV